MVHDTATLMLMVGQHKWILVCKKIPLQQYLQVTI